MEASQSLEFPPWSSGAEGQFGRWKGGGGAASFNCASMMVLNSPDRAGTDHHLVI